MFSYNAARVVFGGIAALLGAFVAVALNIPLPWLLGPLFFVGILRLASAPVATIRPLRNIGQWIIGVSLGLYFSPEIVSLIAQHWLALALGMLVALMLAMFGTWLLCLIGRVDVKTAWFASAIGGASEMSILAERHGARVDLVATAHSLRVLAVVTIIPFGFELGGIVGSDDSLLNQTPMVYHHVLMIGLIATVFGFVLSRLRISSAWMLGPLFATAVLTVLEITTTSIPGWLINSGQLLLGWALGDRYRPAFFKAAPRFMLAVGLFSLISIGFVSIVGLSVAHFSNLPLPTVWLGMAPGGLAEMAITAKVLMLGVPMVTAFQVSRMTFVVLTAGMIYRRVLSRWEKC